MKWPWVSRHAFEVQAKLYSEINESLLRQVDEVQERNARLQEHLIRITRVQSGLGEHMREPREPRKIEPMPMALQIFFDEAFSTDSIRREQLRLTKQKYVEGMSWQDLAIELGVEL